ncbi:MAG: outer membrane protein assembly factor BamA [Gammaproteobacteria bacterium]
MFKNILLVLLFIPFLLFNVVIAEEENSENQLSISKIIIQGNQRVTDDTILTYANIFKGDQITSELIKNVIKRLYDTNYFDDISVTQNFNDLIISVTEKPIVSSIIVTDNNIIEDEDIITALEDVGISRTQPFDKNIFDKIEQELVRLYFDRGRYNASIKTKVNKLERNRVSLELIIKEGDASTIKEINIIGNKVFDNKKLLSIMDLGTTYFFEFWSSKDTYSSSVLRSDISKIENYYFDRGYVRFRVVSNQVNLSNNNKDIIITINVDEGDKYEFGDLKLFGNSVLPKLDVINNISSVILPKQTFSRNKLKQSEDIISYMLGNAGFAFPEIQAIPIIDDATKIVDVEFRITPGQKSLVRRINIIGNDNTNDEVYRRELRQFESSLHNNAKIERSKIRLQRLKFVEDVKVEKTRVSNSNDLVDVTFRIKERKAGEFKVSAGWSDTDGAIFDIDLQQDNFLGIGKNVGLKASKSTVNTSLRFLLTDPFYTADGVSRTVNAVISQTDVSGTSTSSYLSDVLGGGVLYNMPISETATIGVGYDLTYTDFTTTAFSPIIVTHHIEDHGDTAFGLSLKGSYVSDTRNRTIFAEAGILNSLSTEIFLGLEGASYASMQYRTESNKGYVLKTFGFDWPTVLQAKTVIGLGVGLEGATSLPFYSKFFAGGNTTVRGFKAASLGPLTYNAGRNENTCAAKAVPGKFIECDAVGGDFLTAAQFNWIFSPPAFLGEDTRSLRSTLFIDVGNVFEKVNNFEYNELRASYGVEFNVLTPIGGVTVGFVDTLKTKEGDDTQQVVFQLGGNF